METSHFHNYPNSSSKSRGKKLVLLLLVQHLFTLRLVADGGSDLTLDVLFLAVDDEEQRRVHSYTPEVKRLPDRKYESQTI